MSFTFAQLKQAIQDYTENDETTFVNSLPTFIRLAEERILKMVQLSLFRKNAGAAFVTSNPYLAVPGDFLAPYSLSFTAENGKKSFLDFKDVNFIQEFGPDVTVTGVPRYYAQFDVENFIVSPTPDGTYAVELHYFYRPQSLTAGAEDGTTWLSKNAELALLYGSLIEAYTFMKGESEIIQNYMARFQEAIGGMKLLGEAKEVTDQYRTGMVIREKQ